MAATNSLLKYAHAYKRLKAYDAICKDLKKSALRELQRTKEQKAIVSGVEFHVTRKVSKTFPRLKPILDKLTAKIAQLKETAISTGQYKTTEAVSFDAEIPKSAAKELLAKSTKDFAEHFAIKK